MYLSLSTQPSRVCVACTPSGMCGNTIETSGCLHGDCAMGCVSFLLTDAAEVPAYGSLSSPLDSGCLVMPSTCPSSYSTEPTTVFGLAPSDSVCSLLPPFVLWVASGLAGCCGLLVALCIVVQVNIHLSHRWGLLFFLYQCDTHWFNLRWGNCVNIDNSLSLCSFLLHLCGFSQWPETAVCFSCCLAWCFNLWRCHCG
jgi:hypothetical protein